MNLHWLDMVVIAGFFGVIFTIAAYYAKAGGKNTGSFFLSGRDLPWYLAGTAMVATTFAADTPLAVTELVAQNGIAGNWLWWNLAIGGMLTVFFFSRLWRRSGVMTDVEFIEFRYSGKEAAGLRGFRAVYLGLFMNAIVLGWVHLAMETIFDVIFPGINAFFWVAVIAIIIAIYASASGLKGTARTDSFQFVFAITGCIILAIIVVKLPEIGGAVELKNQLSPDLLRFVPRIGEISATGITGGALALSAGAFAAYVGLQWWSSWYPGADPGGGGYVAQRMMSAKDEKHSLFATLWFNIAHYTIRPWPWIIVALCALVLLPRAQSPAVLEQENPDLYAQVMIAYDTDQPVSVASHGQEFADFYEKYENTINPRVMYPKLMLRYLPKGLLGLLIAVFLAAYMSTIASQLNWGTSYIINDFYRRFVRRDADETHYVKASRLSMLFMVVFSLVITKFFLTNIQGAWLFVINASAGMGAVLILRWFWWRINAWSEISAMVAPLIIYPVSRSVFHLEPPITLFPTVFGTSVVWLVVTFLTRPVERPVLHSFYEKVHPGGMGWRPIARELPHVKGDTGFGRLFLDWICGVVMIYASLFAIGKFIFSEYKTGIIFLIIGIVAAIIIYIDLKRRGFETLSK